MSRAVLAILMLSRLIIGEVAGQSKSSGPTDVPPERASTGQDRGRQLGLENLSQARLIGETPRPAAVPDMDVPAPGTTNRVTAGALLRPARAVPGEIVTLFVKLRIAPGHWIYALKDAGNRNVATTIDAETTSNYRQIGSWQSPPPETKSDDSRIYTREVVLQGQFQVVGAAEGVRKLAVTVRYQVCNEALCWPPKTIPLESELTVVRSR